MIFYLGTHHPHWLSRVDVPLFVSRRSLARYKTPPRAKGEWALDSGGFTELSTFGSWQTSATQYVAEVRRWKEEVGNLRWAAIQDWMCEPFITAKTGLSIAEHQRRTIASYRELRDLSPELPWVPVLQGWTYADYLRHVDQYEAAGVNLKVLPLMGLGSVCRRQGTAMAEELIRRLAGEGVRLHGFGFKLTGLRRCARYLASSDSLAWSFDARRGSPLPGCTHRKCANCVKYALRWRDKALRATRRSEREEQQVLF